MWTNVNTILVTLTQGQDWTNTQLGQATLQVEEWARDPCLRETKSPLLNLGLQDVPLLVQTHQQDV